VQKIVEASNQKLEQQEKSEKEPSNKSEEEVSELKCKPNKELKEQMQKEVPPFLTLKALCLKENEEAINDYIDHEILNKDDQCKLFFKTLLSLPPKEPLLIAILERVLARMNDQEIFGQRDILEKIKSQRDDCVDLITFHLQRAYALALIHAYLQDATDFKGQAALLSHFWYVPTEFFLKTICQQAMEGDAKKVLLLLQAATFLISRMHFYPISSSLLFDLYSKFKSLSSKEDPDMEQAKQKLLLAILRALKQTPRASPKSFGQVMENLAAIKTPHQFVEISEAISENRVTEKMVKDFAWDLKKLEATFLTSIIPVELTGQEDFDVWKTIYIEWTNRIIHFVAAHILSYKDIRVRARCCEFYIQVIKQCFEMGNLNTAHALFGALGHASIYRLKQTWNMIPKKALMEFQQKEEFFSPLKNYKNYNSYVQQWKNKHKEVNAQNCLIPLFCRYLTYFTFIQDGNSMHLKDGLLNPDRFLLLAEQHHSLQNYQSQLLQFPELLSQAYTYDIPYQLKIKDHAIQNYSNKFEEALEALLKRSKKLEPPPVKEIE
jgi:hypothetical protein